MRAARHRRSVVLWGASLPLLLGVVGAARAAPSSAEGWLSWSSSSDLCGDAGDFAAQVERALGRSPALAASAVHVNVTAHVATATSGGISRWVGEVQLRGDDQRDLGLRTIDRRDASCQPLIEAMAVVTALALADDGLVPPQATAGATRAGAPPPSGPAASPVAAPQESTAGPAAPPPGSEPASPAPSLEPVASLAQAPAPSSSSASRRWRPGLEGGARIGVGQLPHVAFGAEVSVYLRIASGWKISLAFSGWQRQTSLDGAGRGASFQRLEVGVGVCPVTLTRGAWDGAACLGGDVGRLSITGVGFTPSSTQDRLVLDAGAGVALNRRLGGPLAAGVSAGVTAPLIRDRIGYGTTGGGEISIFRQSPAAVVGTLRLSVVF